MSGAVEAFRQGCRAVLSCWTALNLAVENGWGGDNSEHKREELIGQTVDFCLSKKELYSDEVEDLLFDRIQTLFNVDIEDGSEVEIASLLVRLHNSCKAGDLSYAEELCRSLKKCDSAQCRVRDTVEEASSDEDDAMDESGSIPEEEVDAVLLPVDTKMRNRKNKTEELDDGWTKVL